MPVRVTFFLTVIIRLCCLSPEVSTQFAELQIKDSRDAFGHVKPEAAPPSSRRQEGVQLCVPTSSQIMLLAPQCGKAVLLLAPAPISFSQMKRQYMPQGASYQLRIATRDSTRVFTM